MHRPLQGLAVAVLALTVASPELARAQANDGPRPQSGARITAQVTLGAVLTPVAFFGTGWAVDRFTTRRGWSETGASRAGYISAYSATWLAAAAGPTLVGRDGKMVAALGGSLAGMGASVVSARVGNWIWDDDRRNCGIGCWTLGIATIALPSIGATLAYNASRR